MGGGARTSGTRQCHWSTAGEGCCTHPTTAAAGGFFVVGTFYSDTAGVPRRRKERRHRRCCGSPRGLPVRRMPTAWAIRRRQPIMRRPAAGEDATGEGSAGATSGAVAAGRRLGWILAEQGLAQGSRRSLQRQDVGRRRPSSSATRSSSENSSKPAAGAATAMLPTSDEASYFFIRALPAGIRGMRVPESGLVWQAMPRCRPLTCWAGLASPCPAGDGFAGSGATAGGGPSDGRKSRLGGWRL